MIDKLDKNATLEQVIDVVNAIGEAHNRVVRGSAHSLLLNLVQNPTTPLPLGTVHAAPDGEEILVYLMDKGLVEVGEGNILVPTDEGREQAEKFFSFVEDQVDEAIS